ncbi:MAG TPA: hypothetical protein VF941_24885 [Clostridia bacterium]
MRKIKLLSMGLAICASMTLFCTSSFAEDNIININVEREQVIYVSPGVKCDGGGFVITANGKIIRVPPRGPEFRETAAAYQR